MMLRSLVLVALAILAVCLTGTLTAADTLVDPHAPITDPVFDADASHTATTTVPVPATRHQHPNGADGQYYAALLTPKFAMCIVKANPGMVRFVRTEASYYPSLNVYFTVTDKPRLQVFHSEAHRRANIVDSDAETEDSIIERLLNPTKTIEPPITDMELGEMSATEIAKALEFYGIKKSSAARPNYPEHEAMYLDS